MPESKSILLPGENKENSENNKYFMDDTLVRLAMKILLNIKRGNNGVDDDDDDNVHLGPKQDGW